MGDYAYDGNYGPLENAVLMDALRVKHLTPIISACAVAAAFGLGVIFFVQAYSGYLRQAEALELMGTRVRLVRTQKNELILKERILNRTRHFVDTAHGAGLFPARWTTYDVNLNEAVAFDKADQIINQCANSQVAYFQPLSLQIRMTPKQIDGAAKKGTESMAAGDLTLNVQGKFLARQP